jgi:hypothetical protein
MKKSYEKPEIKEHGDIKTLTKGGTIGGEDEDNSAS